MLSPGTLPQYAAYRTFRPTRSSDGRSVRPSFNNTFPTRSGERVGSECTVLNSKPGKGSMQSESGSQLTHPWRIRIFPPHKPLQDFVHWKMARSMMTMQILPQTVGFDVGWFFRCWVDAKRVVLMTMWECRIALSSTAGGRLQSFGSRCKTAAREWSGHTPRGFQLPRRSDRRCCSICCNHGVRVAKAANLPGQDDVSVGRLRHIHPT